MKLINRVCCEIETYDFRKMFLPHSKAARSSIKEQFTKVQALSSLRTSPHPSHLAQPHPHAVKRKVIIISDCRLVPY